MDLTLLSSVYEPSLYQRLRKFADGIYQGRDYYVSAEDFPVTEEAIRELDLLNSGEHDRNVALLTLLWDTELLSPGFTEFFTGKKLSDFEEVEAWRQYVIYSDDYAEGVNFLIWYFRLKTPDGAHMELLMDAEDNTVYGIWADHNTFTTQRESIAYYELFRSTLIDMLGFGEEDIRQMCYAVYYLFDCVETQVNGAGSDDDSGKLDLEDLEQLFGSSGATDVFRDKNTLFVHIFCSAWALDFSMRTTPAALRSTDGEAQEVQDGVYWYPDIYCGIDDICRLIPEFAERM